MFGLFRPAPLKAVLAAFDDLRPTFHQSAAAVELVFSDARSLAIRERGNTVASIKEQKWKPRDLALLLISKMAFRQAASGHHHIHRNRPTATGNALRAVFEQAGREMVASGFIPEAENEEDQRTIRKAMSEVG